MRSKIRLGGPKMTDRAFGIGHAISSAVQDLEERVARKERETQGREAAIDKISKHIADYLEGGPDREADDLEIGRKVVLDPEIIGLRWKVVRGKRAKAEAAASFKNPEVQPKVEKPEEVVKPKPFLR